MRPIRAAGPAAGPPPPPPLSFAARPPSAAAPACRPSRLYRHRGRSLQGVRIVLNPSKPKLTVVSSACGDGATTSGGSGDCADQFLLTALKDLYETNVGGAKVANRAAGDVMDLSKVRGKGCPGRDGGTR